MKTPADGKGMGMNVDDEVESLSREEMGDAVRGLGMFLIVMLVLVIAIVR